MQLGLGVLWAWLNVALSFITQPQLSSLFVCWLRVVVAFITTAVLIISPFLPVFFTNTRITPMQYVQPYYNSCVQLGYYVSLSEMEPGLRVTGQRVTGSAIWVRVVSGRVTGVPGRVGSGIGSVSLTRFHLWSLHLQPLYQAYQQTNRPTQPGHPFLSG